jgi:uncharacterized phage infection (PIP) family protein YhgE
MNSQLSLMAAGFLMGGAIGGAFAGFAAIINGITERIKEHNTALDALNDKTMDAAERTKILKKEMQELADPSFWETFRLSILASFTGMSNMLSTTQEQMDKIKRAYFGSLLISPDRSYIGSRQNEISQLRYQQSQAETFKETFSYNARILQLQKEIDTAMGKQLEKADKIKRSVEGWYKIMMAPLIFRFPEGMVDPLNKATEQNISKMRFGRGGEIGGMPLGAPIPMQQEAEMMKQRQQDMQQFAQASAGIFAQNMNQAWESIFGEANSMFEQMLSAWQAMLFEKIGFGIFNMLFGGIDLFGFARNLTSGQATAAKYGMGR